MIPVVQDERTGCGIAGVAALAGVSYAVARDAAASMGIFARDKQLWSDTTYVRRLLEHFGIRTYAGETPFRSWDDLPDFCLLAIKWRKTGTAAFWHWVVFHRGQGNGPVVLDPKKSLKNNVRRDFGRMKPKWFIPVYKEK